jgi:rhodanese-related sulfurtransferase
MNLFSKFFQSSPVDSIDAAGLNGQKSKYFILDVRQPEEFKEEHIAGAKLIPLGQLEQRMKELPKNRPIACVCRSGNRSGTAARKLAAAGYKVVNLRGGMIGWRRLGLPIRKGNA